MQKSEISTPDSSATESSLAVVFQRKSKLFQKFTSLVEADRDSSPARKLLTFDICPAGNPSGKKKEAKDHARDYRARKTAYIDFLERKIYELLDYTVEMRRRLSSLASGYLAKLYELYRRSDEQSKDISKNIKSNVATVGKLSAYCEGQIGLQETLAHTHLHMVAAQVAPEFLRAAVASIKVEPSPIAQQRLSFLQMQHTSIISDLQLLDYRIGFQLREWQRLVHTLTNDGVITPLELTAGVGTVLPQSS